MASGKGAGLLHAVSPAAGPLARPGLILCRMIAPNTIMSRTTDAPQHLRRADAVVKSAHGGNAGQYYIDR